MQKTWRWFGEKDLVRLDQMRQIGVEGVVTSLHHKLPGELWTIEDIQAVQKKIEANGMIWSVVESLPVSEEIKQAGPKCKAHLEAYRQSLENLAACGIRTICYNFMPVLDWIRTDLEYTLPNGTQTLYFSWVEFAYFDVYVLKRAGARADYSVDLMNQVDEYASQATEETDQRLIYIIIIKTQGFVNGPLGNITGDPLVVFRQFLDQYASLTKADLRNNLVAFLTDIMPVCDAHDIHMCIHPDDPPYPVLGLPRIVSSTEDIDWLLQAVDNVHNGLTFCAGSLSAGIHNDTVEMAKRFVHRTHFAHLRSCDILPNRDVVEANHTLGRGQVAELVRIFETQAPHIPMRVDHAPTLLDDIGKPYNAGYSLYGRMMALGQIEGMMAMVHNDKRSKG